MATQPTVWISTLSLNPIVQIQGFFNYLILSGFAWYWILVIVVAGVIVIGTTTFLCLRRK